MKIELIERACDVCGSSDFHHLWDYQKDIVTQSGIVQWQVNNVCCKQCGFTFCSPVASDDALNQYYATVFSKYSEESIDYSLKNRITAIKKYFSRARYTDILEVGSNNTPQFLSAMNDLDINYYTVEPNEDCSSDYIALSDVPDNTIDAVISYFVLEHISNISDFFAHIFRILKEGGRLLIEVPDIHFYPLDQSALILHEHVNHFSVVSLTRAAEKNRFTLVDFEHELCSRPFGFLAVFEVSEKQAVENNYINEYPFSKSYFECGVSKIKDYDTRVENMAKKINQYVQQDQNVMIWAANDICHKLMSYLDSPSAICFVDSDSKKKHYLNHYGVSVSTPAESMSQCNYCDLLVVNTALHVNEIINTIKKSIGEKFTAEVCVLSP